MFCVVIVLPHGYKGKIFYGENLHTLIFVSLKQSKLPIKKGLRFSYSDEATESSKPSVVRKPLVFSVRYPPLLGEMTSNSPVFIFNTQHDG